MKIELLRTPSPGVFSAEEASNRPPPPSLSRLNVDPQRADEAGSSSEQAAPAKLPPQLEFSLTARFAQVSFRNGRGGAHDVALHLPIRAPTFRTRCRLFAGGRRAGYSGAFGVGNIAGSLTAGPGGTGQDQCGIASGQAVFPACFRPVRSMPEPRAAQWGFSLHSPFDAS